MWYNKSVRSKERHGAIFPIVNLMATQRSKRTILFKGSFGQHEENTTLLMTGFPFKEFREQSSNPSMGYLKVAGRLSDWSRGHEIKETQQSLFF